MVCIMIMIGKLFSVADLSDQLADNKVVFVCIIAVVDQNALKPIDVVPQCKQFFFCCLPTELMPAAVAGGDFNIQIQIQDIFNFDSQSVDALQFAVDKEVCSVVWSVCLIWYIHVVPEQSTMNKRL